VLNFKPRPPMKTKDMNGILSNNHYSPKTNIFERITPIPIDTHIA